MSDANDATYLGDGVYVCFEQGLIKLTTSMGETEPTNTIWLEVQVANRLLKWIAKTVGEKKA